MVLVTLFTPRLPVVVFALALDDVRTRAAVLLPLLCLADIFSLILWRRHADRHKLMELAPWVIGGMLLALLVLGLPIKILTGLVGGIVVLMVAMQIRRRLRGDLPAPHSKISVAGHGLLAGLATTAANAAGPVMNLYLLGRRLPKEEFIATGAWFFFVINLVKIPIYAAMPLVGNPAMFTGRGLLITACLAPVTAIGALAGGAIGRRIPQASFDWTVLALALAGGLGILVKCL